MEGIMETNKMETRDIFPLLMSMSLPMVLSMLVQSLYNIIDSIYVSYLGTGALTAVSLAFPLQNIVLSVAVGIGVGIASVLSISLGKKDQKRANEAATMGMALTLIHCVLFVILGLVITEPFIGLFTKEPEVMKQACDYTYIVLCFSFGSLLQIAMEKIYQGIGAMKTTMILLGAGAMINIILDPIFIFGFGLGVRGAALATVISQACSCIWVLTFLFGKKTTLKLKVCNMKLQSKIILPSLALGSSIFVMQASESIISVCFNSSLLKYGGDIAVGAMTILTSVMQFAMLPLQGVGQGSQPIISYNYGAKNVDRVKSAFKLLLKVSLTYSVFLWLCVMIFPQVFAGMFTSDATLLAFTAKALRIYLACLFMFGIQIACQMTFTSIGRAKASIIVAVMRKFILLIPLIYIMPAILHSNQTMAVYMAEPIADFLAVTFTAVLFFFEFRKALRELFVK